MQCSSFAGVFFSSSLHLYLWKDPQQEHSKRAETVACGDNAHRSKALATIWGNPYPSLLLAAVMTLVRLRQGINLLMELVESVAETDRDKVYFKKHTLQYNSLFYKTQLQNEKKTDKACTEQPMQKCWKQNEIQVIWILFNHCYPFRSSVLIVLDLIYSHSPENIILNLMLCYNQVFRQSQD